MYYGRNCAGRRNCDVLTPLKDMPPCYIVLAKPGINVSTKFVYGSLKLDEIKKHPDIDGLVQDIESQDLEGISAKLGNVLEEVTEGMHPVITEIKQKMMKHGALNAMMSGSGPTVFGIFAEKKKAMKAYNVLKADEKCKQVYITDGGLTDERY